MSTTPCGYNAPSPQGGVIEFPCGGCGRLLKVPPDAAGRQAKCPQCGGVQQVPSAAPPAAYGAPPAFGAQPAYGAPPAYGSQPAGYGAPPMSSPAQPFNAGPSQPARPPEGVTFLPSNPPPVSATPASPAASGATAPSAPSAASVHHQGRDTPIRQLYDRITREISKIYVGQDELVLGTLVALFSSGHVLIESVPGLGKTLFVRTMGRVLGCQFGRIQFTADLMPSDITGAPVFDMKTQEFRFRPGPVFTQFLLADEINRAPAKTHAALLEIMQEYRVTVDGRSHTIERPFLVLATQNPIESEGTYNLPEAQLDRFMFKLRADYPQEQEESQILKLHSQQLDVNKQLGELATVTSPEEILRVTRENAEIRVDERLVDYINKVVRLTRGWPQFHMGA
jgi:MoxR-like ATPase